MTRSTRKEKFSYKDIKSVYTIVLIDKSTGDFHKYKDRYCHTFSTEIRYRIGT